LTPDGSGGLDETLDLFVGLPRLDKALRKEKSPVRCHITGTVDNPKITVKNWPWRLSRVWIAPILWKNR
jgi:hypothetical protein